MRRERTSILPAVLFSALAHVVLLGLAWYYWPKTDPGGGAFGITPVTLVAQGPIGNTTAPVPDTPEEAATPDPVPDEDPAVVAPPTPAPVPTPAPPKTQSKPSTQAPAGAGSRPPADDSFFDRLAKSLPGGGGAQRSGGAQGKPAIKQGTPAGDAGGCLSASNPCPWKEGLGPKIERNWTPNCEVEGGSSVRLTIRVRFLASGYMDGKPEIINARTGRPVVLPDSLDRDVLKTDVVTAAAIRAYGAMKRVEPYSGVPAELVGKRLTVNLNADKACN